MSKVSVAVTNYNGRSVLPETLAALRKLSHPPAEVILADDGSTDDSLQVAQKAWPGLRVIRLPHSGRPNLARNAALRAARFNKVFLIDNDIILEPRCVRRLADILDHYPDAAIVTPRLYYTDDPDRIYLDGQQMHFLAQSVLRNRDSIVPKSNRVLRHVWSGGVMMVNKDMVDSVGDFDEEYLFGWGEDNAIYHKATLRGYTCYHDEGAVAYHMSKRRTTERALAQVRNRWVLIAETYSWRSLVFLAPALALFEVIQFAGLCLKKIPGVYFSASYDFFRNLPAILRKRRWLQSGRQLRDRAILTAGPVYFSPSVMNKSSLRAGWSLINRGFDAYWRVVRVLL